MSVISCPSWCDRTHDVPDGLVDQPRGHLNHHRDIKVPDAAGRNPEALARIESCTYWRTDEDTGRRTVNVSKPGIALSEYFSESLLDDGLLHELLITIGLALQDLRAIENNFI